MPLESGTYIDSLNASNPVGASDPKSQGDDHLRLIKSTVKATFPNIAGAMNLTHTQLNNAAIKTEANQFTSVTSGNNYAIELLSTVPGQLFYESGAGADEKAWDIVAVSGSLRFRSMNDKPITASNTFLQADKSGAEVGTVSIKVANDENAIRAEANGAVRLYHNNSQRLVTATTGLLINGSVSTSAPPVAADAPNTRIQFYDSGSNLLGDVGFLGGSTLNLQSYIHGATVRLTGEDNAGTARLLLQGDPDAEVQLFYNGTSKVQTNLVGIELLGSLNNALGGNVQTYLTFSTSTASDRGYIGFAEGNADFDIRSINHGGQVKMRAENTAGTLVSLVNGDPDGSVTLYEQGGVRLQTISDGINVRGISANDPVASGTQDTRINFQNSVAAQIGILEWNSSVDLRLLNLVRGGNVNLQARNAAGSADNLLFAGDPDGQVLLYYSGGLRLETRANGVVGLRSNGNTDSEDRYIDFMHANGSRRAIVGHITSSVLSIRNAIHGGNVNIQAEDSGGSVRNLMTGDPDGVVELYEDAVATFRTADRTAADKGTGAEVLDGGGTFRPVGFNVLPLDGTFGSANVTLSLSNVGSSFEYNTGTARSLFINSDANIPVGASWSCVVGPSGGTLTADGGTGVTIRYWNGASYTTTSAAGNVTLGEGRHFIYKIADTQFQIDGPNIS